MKMIKILAAGLGILLLTVQVQAGTISGKVDGGKRLKKASAVVYLAKAPGVFKAPAENPTVDQKNMTFIPHVLAIQTGTTVDFLNNDEVRHNVFSPSKEKYNLGTWPHGAIKERTFETKGVYKQLCNVHPEMEAFIIVLDTPYFAVTAVDGSYSIKDVPKGEYTVKVWHEKLKFGKQKGVKVDGGETEVNFVPRKRRR